MSVLNAIRDRTRAAHAARLLQQLPCIAHTRYRQDKRRDLERFLEVASPFHGVAYTLPVSTRAQLMMVRCELEPSADLAAVFEYLKAVIADEPVETLERLVIETGSAELMRRFHRWVPSCDRTHVWGIIKVTEVMTS